MTRQDTIRSKLLTKVFTPLGKSVTLKSISSPIFNSRGEQENQTTTSSTITIVPYGEINRRSFERFGDLQPGEVEAAIPYDVSIHLKDIITMEGDDWIITQVEPNWLPDNVVTIVRMAKVLA